MRRLFILIFAVKTGVMFAVRWYRAVNYLAGARYEEAYREFEKIYKSKKLTIPSEHMRYYVNAQAGHAAAATGRYDLAVKALRMALHQVKYEKSLTQDEKNYIYTYCVGDIRYCAERMKDYSDAPDREILPINTSNVSRFVRENFPLDQSQYKPQ